jgi:hypothetical protein
MKEDDQTDPDKDQQKEDFASPPLFGTFFLTFWFHVKPSY